MCFPAVQFWPYKYISNQCSNPGVIQLIEGKGVQHHRYLSELCAKACCVFGTGRAVSLAEQTEF